MPTVGSRIDRSPAQPPARPTPRLFDFLRAGGWLRAALLLPAMIALTVICTAPATMMPRADAGDTVIRAKLSDRSKTDRSKTDRSKTDRSKASDDDDSDPDSVSKASAESDASEESDEGSAGEDEFDRRQRRRDRNRPRSNSNLAIDPATSQQYGVEGRGWFLNFHCFTKYVKVAFFRGTSLRPVPPGKSAHKEVRYVDIYEDEPIDEAEMAKWIKQAARLPGWIP